MPDSSHRKIPVLDDIISTPVDLDEEQTVSVATNHSAEIPLDEKIIEPVLNPAGKPTDNNARETPDIDIRTLSEAPFEPRIEPVIDKTVPAIDNEQPLPADTEQKPRHYLLSETQTAHSAPQYFTDIDIDTDAMAKQIVQTLLPDFEQQLNELVRSSLEDALKNK